jgi:hypothetical protein
MFNISGGRSINMFMMFVYWRITAISRTEKEEKNTHAVSVAAISPHRNP